MSTWTGKFKPLPGQTLGPGGTIQEGPSSAIDSLLGLAPMGGGESFAYDYHNRSTDNFLRDLVRTQNRAAGDGVQGAINSAYMQALSGLTSGGAGRMLRERDALRKGSARAFIGPDGTYQYREQGVQGWGEQPSSGSVRVDGRGSFDPVGAALSSDDFRSQRKELDAILKRAGVAYQKPTWLYLTSWGKAPLPHTPWNNAGGQRP